MTQILFASSTSPLLTDLDANFTELYGRTTPLTSATNALGVGSTLNAWNSGQKAIQVNGAAWNAGGTNDFSLSVNAYFNTSGVWTYVASSAAVNRYTQAGGQHQWHYAAAGTAGAAITWTQQMTLDTSGNLMVGVTSGAAQGVTIQPNGSSANAANINICHISGTSTGAVYTQYVYNSAAIGSVTQSGTTAVLYNTTSDERLKNNIADAADAGAVLDAVKVRQYDWKADGSHQRFGFVAQELITVVPEAVYSPSDPDDMMAVDYSKLVPLLVKEVQSLRSRLASHGL